MCHSDTSLSGIEVGLVWRDGIDQPIKLEITDFLKQDLFFRFDLFKDRVPNSAVIQLRIMKVHKFFYLCTHMHIYICLKIHSNVSTFLK